MDFGDVLLRFALVAVAAAGIFFLRERGRRRVTVAAGFFGLHTALVVGALVFLFALFLGHRFDYSYVAEHSSRALSPSLALAATWAGQEGSILLWVAITALVGIALLFQPGPLARPAMAFVSLAQVTLMSLLMIRSPFGHSTVVPADGLGLNPLLEDPWMVIHPPVLFLGYAAMLVPAALAAAALVRGERREWNRMTWPWALFGVLSLGTGIALGGVWAYKVLGWGGYWGWDPVENASLVPWLVAVALLHGLMIQRTTGALARTNFVLAFVGWFTVVGGTYLTRSGVLQDFSVHSFADTGLNLPLVATVILFALLPAALLAWRWRDGHAAAVEMTAVSRESALWLGMFTVLAVGALVLVGTTAPLLTRLFGPPARVENSFYETVTLPFGIAMVILMGVSPALRWFRQQGLGWLSALAPGAIGAALVTVPAYFAGLHQLGLLLVIVVAGFALGVNLVVATRLFRRGWMYGAGYLGHAGIAVMVMGMALSTGLGRSERLQLTPGQRARALGYELTLQKVEHGTRGDQTMAIEVKNGAWSFAARPQLMPSPQSEGMMRRPAIDGRREIYLAPVDLKAAAPAAHDAIWLERGKATEIGGVQVTFRGFRMESNPEFRVYADLEVEHAGMVMPVAPAIAAGPDGQKPVAVEVPGLGTVQLAQIDADHGRVAIFAHAAAAAPPLAIVDFSTKPFINLVWVGAVLTILGTALAGMRRAAERKPVRERARVPEAAHQSA